MMKKILLGVMATICLIVWAVFIIVLTTDRSTVGDGMLASGRMTVLKSLEIPEEAFNNQVEMQPPPAETPSDLKAEEKTNQPFITKKFVAGHTDTQTMSIDELMKVLNIQ
ncbi:hypothetical protein LC040_13225 [Bacillus tianshenii]|nr:hypothetical protein LC040_13225 [Bacillus tianshenii]